MSARKKHPAEFILPNGMEVDLDEAWRKLISSQFTGSPGRGFGELIQNFLDSYPATTPWDKRQGVIKSDKNKLQLIDYGEGMPRKRLELLVTLGGTDKNHDKDKIGTFGIGFFSIFNPRLGTLKVTVTTRCEDQVVEMVFTVIKAGTRPQISSRILAGKINYSTCIKIEFNEPDAIELCLEHARECLRYYPCRVTINGRPHSSIWQEAEQNKDRLFKQDSCDGFISPYGYREVTLLCKYEYLLTTSIAGLVTGGHGMEFDLRDYKRKAMPYLPDVTATINCNDLSVTISRDGFQLDSAYHTMVRTLAKVMADELYESLKHHQDHNNGLIPANQYTLISQLEQYLDDPDNSEPHAVIPLLAKAKVYRINGKRQFFSLQDLLEMKSADLPLFYSPAELNLHWLGGNFKHDFVVLPPYCDMGQGAPNFYDLIFREIFTDVVNLDIVKQQNDTLQELVERGIVTEQALQPKVEMVGERHLDQEELRLLTELDSFFARPSIREVISRNLHLPAQAIRAVFFDVTEQKGVIATGLFDGEGRALSEASHCNLDPLDSQGNPTSKVNNQDIVLGLHRDHELIRAIIGNRDPNRLYFALPILSHELALCQKVLVPYSPCYHLVKERLAADMRQALMTELLPDKKAA